MPYNSDECECEDGRSLTLVREGWFTCDDCGGLVPDEDEDDEDDEPQPVTITAHMYDGEPCEEDPESYEHLCVHGCRLMEVYTQPMYPPEPTTPG